MFDEPTRAGQADSLIEWGNAFAGRGDDLNRGFRDLGPLLDHLEPALANLVARETAVRRAVPGVRAGGARGRAGRARAGRAVRRPGPDVRRAQRGARVAEGRDRRRPARARRRDARAARAGAVRGGVDGACSPSCGPRSARSRARRRGSRRRSGRASPRCDARPRSTSAWSRRSHAVEDFAGDARVMPGRRAADALRVAARADGRVRHAGADDVQLPGAAAAQRRERRLGVRRRRHVPALRRDRA